MEEEEADALAAFRARNYDLIYLRPASLQQGQAVMGVLRALVEHFADRPHLIAETSEGARPRSRVGGWGRSSSGGGSDPASSDPAEMVAGGEEAIRAAVTYVAGMTDRFAFRQAVALLGWDADKLPTGVDA
jgi:dGTPase